MMNALAKKSIGGNRSEESRSSLKYNIKVKKLKCPTSRKKVDRVRRIGGKEKVNGEKAWLKKKRKRDKNK